MMAGVSDAGLCSPEVPCGSRAPSQPLSRQAAAVPVVPVPGSAQLCPLRWHQRGKPSPGMCLNLSRHKHMASY